MKSFTYLLAISLSFTLARPGLALAPAHEIRFAIEQIENHERIKFALREMLEQESDPTILSELDLAVHALSQQIKKVERALERRKRSLGSEASPSEQSRAERALAERALAERALAERAFAYEDLRNELFALQEAGMQAALTAREADLAATSGYDFRVNRIGQ